MVNYMLVSDIAIFIHNKDTIMMYFNYKLMCYKGFFINYVIHMDGGRGSRYFILIHNRLI